MLIICIDIKGSFASDVTFYLFSYFCEKSLPNRKKNLKIILLHPITLCKKLDIIFGRSPNPQLNNSCHLMKTQIKSILVQTFSIINLIYQLTLFFPFLFYQFECMFEEIHSDFNKKFSLTTNDTHFPCNFLPSMLFIFPMPN